MRLSTVMVVLSLAEHTVVDWFNYMREECTHKLLTLNIRLGGPGRIVEIDESVMIKRKYNRGARRQQHQQWVFGIYDRETKVGYLQFVDHRDEATLFPIIQQYVIPGTTINSDGWATYQNLPRLGYQHDVTEITPTPLRRRRCNMKARLRRRLLGGVVVTEGM
eukprot:gene5846-6545_t